MLPGINGFDVVAELRQAGRFVPVLMLTARGRPEDVLRGFEAGVDDYLTKPFELSVLIARINGLLRRREWFQLDESRSLAKTTFELSGDHTGELFVPRPELIGATLPRDRSRRLMEDSVRDV